MQFWEAMQAAQEGGHQVRPTSWAGVGYLEWDSVNGWLMDDQGAQVTQDYSDEATWETVETLITASAAFQEIFDGGECKRAAWPPSQTLKAYTDPVLGELVVTIGGARPVFKTADLIASDWVIVTPAP